MSRYPFLFSETKTVWFIVLFCCCLIAPNVMASEGGPAAPAPQISAPPVPVDVGLYLLNITDFDPRLGMFEADFYLDMRSTDIDPTKFALMNGATLSTRNMSDRPNIYQYRIRSRLTADMDFRHYPFDKHRLIISLEDDLLDTTQMVYTVNKGKTGVDPVVRVQGWNVGLAWDAFVDRHKYTIYPDYYSRYNFQITISRQLTGVLIKSLLPALLVLLAGFFSLLLTSETMVGNRLSVLTGSLIASVLLHLNVASSIPPVGYMTFFDRVMIINYFGLVGGVGFTTLMVFFRLRKNDRVEKSISRLVPILPALWTVLQIFNALSLGQG